MAKQLPELSSFLIDFINNQKIFFVATAMKEGRINLSPKGMDTFRIINSKKAIWLNLTGSGNETSAHLLESNRMTIMFCAFENKPLILRLYCTAKTYHVYDEKFQEYLKEFPSIPGARQIFELDIELVQTSCGFAVPIMEYKEERSQLIKWANNKGSNGLHEYWKEKNSISLDGHPTGLKIN